MIHLNWLTFFGFVAVSLMLIFYTLENRSTYCVLGFAVSLYAWGSMYGVPPGRVALWNNRGSLVRHRPPAIFPTTSIAHMISHG